MIRMGIGLLFFLAIFLGFMISEANKRIEYIEKYLGLGEHEGE